MKALVNAGGNLTLTKSGMEICQSVKFNHPFSNVVMRAAKGLYETHGDGINTFILVVALTFSHSFTRYTEQVKIPHIVNSLQLATNDILQFMENQTVPLNSERHLQIVANSLATKIAKFS